MADTPQPTDADGVAQPPTDDDIETVEWSIELLPTGGERGIVKSVPFGLGSGPTKILLEVGLTADERGVTFGLIVGDGPGASNPDELATALGEVADMLDGFIEALRDAAPSLVQAARDRDAQGGDDDAADR